MDKGDKDMNTRKISQQTRYVIEKRELELDYDCEHPMCATMHKKWISGGICKKPTAPQFDWIIWNEDKKEVAEVFEYQRDAKSRLQSIINSLTDDVWQQITKAGA